MALKLVGEVSLDGSGFEGGLKRIETAGERVFGNLKRMAVGAFGVYGIEEAIRKTVEYADKMADSARRLGVGVEALQELGFAARQNGADIENLTTFIEKLNSARIDPKKLGSFGKLGIGQGDLQNLPAEDIITKLSANLRNRSSQEVIGPLRDIGGRGAGALLPMLKEDLDAVRQAARDAGAVMRGEQIASLKLVVDEMHLLSQVLLVQLAPAIVTVMEIIAALARVIKADFAFWQSFGGRTKKTDWLAVADFITNPLEWFSPSKKTKEGVGNIGKAFSAAGASSNAGLEDETKSFAARLVALTNALKNPEHPDFESVMGQPSGKRHPRAREAIDGLARVGNFLGADTQNMMQTIATQQLDMLKKIEYNTRPSSTSATDSTDFPVN
jgi:hypothetical protein